MVIIYFVYNAIVRDFNGIKAIRGVHFHEFCSKLLSL